jgi:hypothetical protein
MRKIRRSISLSFGSQARPRSRSIFVVSNAYAVASRSRPWPQRPSDADQMWRQVGTNPPSAHGFAWPQRNVLKLPTLRGPRD